uniref:Uncharacterized protein n=2 Tax=Aegilops tauschii subsp. strangulata TaxID=200361 RepID=A0A453FIP7_AEGTS
MPLFTCVRTMDATFILITSITAIANVIIHKRREQDTRKISSVYTIKFAFWASRSAWLVGSIGAIAVSVVEPAPGEGARAVPAGDHLRREVRLVCRNNLVRTRGGNRCGGGRTGMWLLHPGEKRRLAVARRRRRR